jgi:hypothetical protein
VRKKGRGPFLPVYIQCACTGAKKGDDRSHYTGRAGNESTGHPIQAPKKTPQIGQHETIFLFFYLAHGDTNKTHR